MEHKAYYAIIPANVRYDKRLKANVKLLYGEITALCNEKGFCWATNEYFAELYDVDKATVSRWISSLVEFGYIANELIYAEGTKQIINRYIRISQEPIDKKINTPIDEKVIDNNTYINNTNNTMSRTFSNENYEGKSLSLKENKEGKFSTLDAQKKEKKAYKEKPSPIFAEIAMEIHNNLLRLEIIPPTRRFKPSDSDFIRKLIQLDGYTEERVRRALEYYFQNIEADFIPECRSIKTFRDKFDKIIAFCNRHYQEQNKKR